MQNKRRKLILFVAIATIIQFTDKYANSQNFAITCDTPEDPTAVQFIYPFEPLFEIADIQNSSEGAFYHISMVLRSITQHCLANIDSNFDEVSIITLRENIFSDGDINQQDIVKNADQTSTCQGAIHIIELKSPKIAALTMEMQFIDITGNIYHTEVLKMDQFLEFAKNKNIISTQVTGFVRSPH